MIQLDNIRQRGRKLFAFLFSHVTDEPVFFGRGFTTSDESLSDKQSLAVSRVQESTREDEEHRKFGVIQYRMDSDARFELVGFYDLHGKTVARIHDKLTGLERNIDLSFFKTYFKSV